MEDLSPRVRRMLSRHSPDEVARRLLEERMQNKSKYQVASELGFNRGLINYVMDGAHSPEVLKALGLPVLEKRDVEICMHCGRVHTMHKTCVEQRPQRDRYRVIGNLESPEQVKILKTWARKKGFKSWTDYCRQMATHLMDGKRLDRQF